MGLFPRRAWGKFWDVTVEPWHRAIACLITSSSSPDVAGPGIALDPTPRVLGHAQHFHAYCVAIVLEEVQSSCSEIPCSTNCPSGPAGSPG